MLSTQWRPQTLSEGMSAWARDRAYFEEVGLHFPYARGYLSEDVRRDYTIAMDALPTLTTDPSSAIPAMLTTFIDPDIIRVLYAPLRMAEIFGEVKKGDWLMETAMFPVVEATGEVSTYGDFSEQGRAGINTNFPNRQSYLFQLLIEYGDREMDRMGLAKINYVADLNKAAALSLNKFGNFSYAFGIAGLQNYGALNDPNLTAPLTPSTKAYSLTNKQWISGGVVLATANEIFTDIQSLFELLVNQSNGLVTRESELILAMSPGTEVALTATNSFNVNVSDLLNKNFPNMKVMKATQYAAISSSNPQQGLLGGNLVQLICPEVEGQRTAYCAYNEKMRAHPIIRAVSSFRQKTSSGTWGWIGRMTFPIAQMIGV